MINARFLQKVWYLSLFTFLFATTGKAQDKHRCGSDEKMEAIYLQNPEYLEEIQQGKKAMYAMRASKVSSARSSSMVSTIPVHVIIVHPPGQPIGSGDNLSLSHVESQIEVLNEDFRRWNSDANNTPSVFSAVDCQIEFCLASVDPNGLATDGITRFGTNQNFDNNEFSIKSQTGWDRSTYLNIWVAPTVGPLGYAYVPSPSSLPNPVLDGVVVFTGTFGGPGNATFPPYNLGRTTTHEVGHYLGLGHIWASNGCGADDGFTDTPEQDDENFGCPNHPSPSCGNGGDMFMNYMDYVNDNCMNAFSQDQCDYMNLILSTSRSSVAGSASFACGVGASPLSANILDEIDIECPGDGDGVIEVEAVGGSSPYTFTINPGNQSNNNGYFTGLDGGTYTIDIQESGGNSTQVTVTLDEPPAFFVNSSITSEVSCFDSEDGSFFVNVSGGTGSQYSYTLPGVPSTTNPLFSNMAAGEYEITITDQAGCDTYEFVELFAPPEIGLNIDTVQNISCYGESDGVIEVDPFGGSGTNWSYMVTDLGNVSDTLFSNLAADTFYIVAEDLNGCTDTTEFQISEPDSLILLIDTIVNPTCFADSNATLILSPLGGSGTFIYSYDTLNITSDTLENLFAGEFNITVTDVNNCIDSTSFTIDQPDMVMLNTIELMDADCSGEETGSITVELQNAQGPVTYTLNSGITNNSGEFSGLGEGQFDIIAIDSLGCQGEALLELESSGTITLEVGQTEDVLCFGESNASISVTTSGASSQLSYSLDGINFNTNSAFDNLSAGDYTVYVQDDMECITTQEFFIEEPAELTLEVVNIEDNICAAQADGKADLLIDGGSGNVTIYINGEETTVSALENLTAGNYEVEIIDENNCNVIRTFEIEEPTIINLSEENSTNSNCAEATGTLSVSATGGAGNYTFMLEEQTNQSGEFSMLQSGIYTLTIVDDNECSQSFPIEIGQFATLELEIDQVINEGCFESEDGQANFSINGGTGDIEILLNGEVIPNATLMGLSPGDYILQAIDEESCQDNIMFTIESANELISSLDNIEEPRCNGASDGMLTVNASGGFGQLTYSIDGQTNTDGAFENLGAGEYIVTITDDNTCEITLPVTLEEPISILVDDADGTAPTCHDGSNGSASVVAEGGTGTLTYSLNGVENASGLFTDLTPGDYSIMIEDENGCNTFTELTIPNSLEIEVNTINSSAPDCFEEASGSLIVTATNGTPPFTYTNGNETNTTGQFFGLSSGETEIVVTDDNGCSVQSTFMIDGTPELIISSINTEQVSCFGFSNGSVTVNAQGGNPSYTYILNGVSNTSGVFTDLGAENYIITVIDDNGCESEDSFEISEPEAVAITLVSSNGPLCPDDATGAIEVAGSGGTGDYTYTLDGESNTDGVFDALSSGDYSIIIEDNEGCQSTIPISLEDPEAISITNLVVSDPLCFGGNDGSISINAGGGTGELEYTMSSGMNLSGQFSGLESQVYEIIISDENACSLSTSVTVNSPTAIDTTNILISGVTIEEGGSIQINAIGGTSPYQYSIDGTTFGESNQFSDLEGGNYTVYVQDNQGCVQSYDVNIDSDVIVIGEPEGTFIDPKVYPNPVFDILTVEFGSANEQKITFTTYDDIGRLVETETKTFGPFFYSETFDMSSYASGVYIFAISSPLQTDYFKIVKID